MFSMVAIILEISSEEVEIFSIAVLSWATYSTLMPSCAPACSTNCPASRVAWAVFWAFVAISLTVAESSSTELACSVAPWARDWALLDTWSEPEATCSALVLIWLMVLFRLDVMLSRERLIEVKSPT